MQLPYILHPWLFYEKKVFSDEILCLVFFPKFYSFYIRFKYLIFGCTTNESLDFFFINKEVFSDELFFIYFFQIFFLLYLVWIPHF